MLRQRNIVFPDTVRNEAEFWRNVIRRNTPLTFFQWLLVALMLVPAGCVAFLIIRGAGPPEASPLQKIGFTLAANWPIFLALLLAFLGLRFATKRALRSVGSRHGHSRKHGS